METAARQLCAKFESGRALLEKAALVEGAAGAARSLADELAAVELRVTLATGRLHAAAAGHGVDRRCAQDEFFRVLAAENFANDADRIVERAEVALRIAGVPLRDADPREPAARGRRTSARGRSGARARDRVPADLCADLQRLLDMYPRADRARPGPTPVDGSALPVDVERCPVCNASMSVDASRSELRCDDCGAVRELPGTVFDDAQFYSQEGQKAKSGTFNPNRHFQSWWMHILAREPEDELGGKDDADGSAGERVIEALRAIVVRDQRILQLLTVEDVRTMLREVHRTDLNKNVPLIMRKLTGIGPPQLSDDIAARAENLFTKAIEAGDAVRRSGRVNRNYYPFYCLKILDLIIPETDFESRRVLYYIYIQRKETVEADDADWEMICAEVPELTYRPTDRTLGQNYRPL